jgi:hypothetical protein
VVPDPNIGAREGRPRVKYLRTLYESNKLLTLTGWFHWALLAVLICIYPFDTQSILGVDRWIKPMKFSTSIAIYVWTLAWYLRYLTNRMRAVRFISWGVAISVISEIVCIVAQAARGTTSHYNVATAFNAVVFAFMGVMIGINTFLVLYTLVLFLKEEPQIPRAYLWGIRFGLVVFLLASLVGVVMIRHLAHTVGALDGGPGLPFVNWSREHGDLRVAHFAGMHALQILPLAGFLLHRSRRPESVQVAYTFAISFLYLALAVFLGVEAWQGRPLIGV